MSPPAVARSIHVTLCLTLLSGLLALAPGMAAADPVEVTQGDLIWGVKKSWRNYIGVGLLSDGVSVNPDGTYRFPMESGSYDEETRTTELQFAGTVHWRGYPDYLGPGKWGLDTTFTDLSLEIGPTAQVLRGTNIGYSRDDPGGELHAEVDVVLAKLDVEGATTAFGGGTSSWSAIPAAAGPGMGLYPEGTPIDPVSLTYEGPGGAPDLGEQWDSPGGIALEPGARWVSDKAFGSASNSSRALYASPGGDLLHVVEYSGAKTLNALLSFRALDPATMQPIGQAAEVTYQIKQGQFFETDYDPETETLFYAIGGEGSAKAEVWVRAVRWNGSAYDSEPIGRLRDHNNVESIVWNPVEDKLAVVQQIAAADGASTYVLNELNLFRRGESGQWSGESMPLPMPATGAFAGGEPESSPFNCPSFVVDQSCLGVARDGSYVQAPGSATIKVDGTSMPWPAIHVAVDGGQAVTSTIPGTEATLNEFGSSFGYSATSQGADGSVLLHRTSFSQRSIARVDVVDGAAALTELPYIAAQHGNLSPSASFGGSIEADPERGWEWATDIADPESYVLNAMVDGEIVSRHHYPEFTAQGYAKLAVGPDGSVYIPVRDQATDRFGYQRLHYLGRRAVVDQHPEAVSVALGVDEESETVSFTSTALGGIPAPSRRWQVKAPGASAFADVPGETGATLTVEAERGSGGSSYRAVYSSPAGGIASDPATLSVDYAPLIVSDLTGRSVTEGADAFFLLKADGNPEPEVEWQRRVGGFWQDIASDDDNFVVNGPSLTVLETNVDQSGALFRAKLANSVATVFSKTAKLTVSPKVSIPVDGVDLENVSLEWTGSAEMQRVPFFGDSNYFSAGASDGEEATYDAFADNAAVFQVSSSGIETLATWATRAAHVSSGGHQLVRLHGGEARIEPDGSATVAWDGAFSVNFYGGLVPFTFTDPELVVDADGVGALSADMSGCESSQANPSECTLFDPVPDVSVATFSDVEVDPSGAVSIEPDYSGVEVDVPVPYVPQDRVVTGWGAWPQPFVDFQVKTGLSSHWYSSGGTLDPHKAPDPFTVDFDGEALPAEPEPEAAPSGPDPPPKSPASGPVGAQPAQISTVGGTQAVGRKRLATVAALSCPGEGFCAVMAPRRVKLRISGKARWAKVIAPRTIDGGGEGEVKVKLTKALLRKLGRRTARGRMSVTLRSEEGSVRRTVKVRIRKGGKRKGGKKRPGPVGVGGPQSGPISAEPPVLARPASAVDVGGVKVSWAPRDSWVRYASSGVAPGDGILTSNGAVGTSSTASPCPDRPSTSDAQLPYVIEFAPKASWRDPVSGAAGIYGQGSVSFRWAAHSIDLTAADPEIEINGASSRAIFRFGGSGGTAYPDQRAALVSLDLSGKPTVTNGGKTFTYDLMRGTLTPDGVNVFAGFYTPPDNDEFGCVTVEFTVP